MRSVFASDVGVDEAPIATKDGGFVWFAVTKVEPAHERSFDEAKPQVEAQWRAEQVDKALAAKAADLVKQFAPARAWPTSRRASAPRRSPPRDIRRDEQGGLPERSSPRSSASRADGAGSAATPDGRTVFKITADKTPPVEAPTRGQGDGRSSSTGDAAKA